jgi:hypothetical protein
MREASSMTTDAFDLGIAPEHTYEEEHWRPSTDYPDVTTVRLRQDGRFLEETSTPAYSSSARTRRAEILGVWRNIGRAAIRFEGVGYDGHFDLSTKRVVDLPSDFRLPLPITRDPRSPALWAELLTALSEARLYAWALPETFSPEALTALPLRQRGEDRVASARWPSGYAFDWTVGTAHETIECALVEKSSYLTITMWIRIDGSAPSAQAFGYFMPGLEKLDGLLGRIERLLSPTNS